MSTTIQQTAYAIERALGVPVDAAAELAHIDVRTAWRLEAS